MNCRNTFGLTCGNRICVGLPGIAGETVPPGMRQNSSCFVVWKLLHLNSNTKNSFILPAYEKLNYTLRIAKKKNIHAMLFVKFYKLVCNFEKSFENDDNMTFCFLKSNSIVPYSFIHLINQSNKGKQLVENILEECKKIQIKAINLINAVKVMA